MKMVDRFVSTIYAASPGIESMWCILTNKLGQKAFHNFVRAENSECYFTVFRYLSEVLASDNLSLESLIGHFGRVKSLLLDEDSGLVYEMSPLLRNEMSIGPRDEEGRLDIAHITQLLEKVQNDVVSLMTRRLFQRFLDSKHYRNWRSFESCHAAATTLEDVSVCPTDPCSSRYGSSMYSGFSSVTSCDYQRSRQRSVVQPVSLAITAFASLGGSDLQDVLGLGDVWLSALITAAEALPLGFTVASAPPRQRGFPLIYANNYFEKLTGYTRSSIIGQTCDSLLQCEETEEAAVETLREGLRTLNPCLAILTNQTAAGQRFKCLVALKPLIDEERRYKYVVGLQFDVSQEGDEGASKAALARELLASLPENVYSDDCALQAADEVLLSARLHNNPFIQ
jgi:PAS domain S-box-containing protein